MSPRLPSLGCILVSGLLACNIASGQVHVWTYHNDNARTGLNTNETVLTPANVNSTLFGKLFSYSVDGYVYAQPLYLSRVAIPGFGLRNVLYIATEHNTLYAFDADKNTTGTNGLLWKVNFGTSAATPNNDFGKRYNNNQYTDIVPEVGITGTPVIDVTNGVIYLDAFTHEGSSYVHRIHALNVTNGVELPFSPVVVAASVPGTGVGTSGGRISFVAMQHLQRSALTLANGVVYVAYSGYADTNPYHGWVLGYNASNLQLLTNQVFNTTPNSTIATYGDNAGEGGIWMGGGGLGVDSANNLFLFVGNGVFNATNASGTEYGDSVLKLSANNATNKLAVADYFTPYNQATLAANDTDLGSGALMLIPDQPGNTPHLLVGAGKEGPLYLINRDQMTTDNNHYNQSSSMDHVVQVLSGQTGRSCSTPAYFNGRIYVGSWTDVIKSFSLNNGLLSTTPVSSGSRSFAFPGCTPVITANGTSNGIVWAQSYSSTAVAVLLALNATNLSTEIYNSAQASGNRDRLTNGVKFSLPTVANGKVFVGGQYAVSVFGELAGTVEFAAPTFSVQETNGTATVTVNRFSGASGAAQISYATVPGGSAVSGVNYVSTSGALSWASGDSAPKSFTIPILDDHLGGTNATINLALSSPSANLSIGAQSTALLTIVEGPAGNWRQAHFGANAYNSAIAGDLADPDGDGAANLLEYALASNPTAANTNRSLNAVISGNHLQLTFHRNTSATDLTYVVEASATLQTWTPLATYTAAGGWVANVPGTTTSESASSGAAPDQYVTVTVTDPTALAASRFLRLHVSR